MRGDRVAGRGAGLRVPHADGAVRPGAGQPVTGGCPGHGGHHAEVPPQGPADGSLGPRVPQLDSPVGAGGVGAAQRQAVPVRAPGQACQGGRVGLRGAERLPGCDVPQLHEAGAVRGAAPDREPGSVGAEGQGGHLGPAQGQRAPGLPQARGIPDVDRAVAAACCDEGSVGAQREGGEGPLDPLDGRPCLLGGRVPGDDPAPVEVVVPRDQQGRAVRAVRHRRRAGWMRLDGLSDRLPGRRCHEAAGIDQRRDRVGRRPGGRRRLGGQCQCQGRVTGEQRPRPRGQLQGGRGGQGPVALVHRPGEQHAFGDDPGDERGHDERGEHAQRHPESPAAPACPRRDGIQGVRWGVRARRVAESDLCHPSVLPLSPRHPRPLRPRAPPRVPRAPAVPGPCRASRVARPSQGPAARPAWPGRPAPAPRQPTRPRRAPRPRSAVGSGLPPGHPARASPARGGWAYSRP